MKNRTLLLFGALLLSVSLVAWAATDGHARSLDDVEAEIRSTLGLAPTASIDPAAVPEELMLELGDAVMGAHVGDSERHEWMDQMMGGEGSDSLDASHRWMAYQYLTGNFSPDGYGMMGPGMMGRGMHGGWMSGNSTYDGNPYQSPEELLRRRYAEGEISRSQYQQMLRDLSLE